METNIFERERERLGKTHIRSNNQNVLKRKKMVFQTGSTSCLEALLQLKFKLEFINISKHLSLKKKMVTYR